MSDPTELAGVGVGGATAGGLLIWLLKASGSRNIGALDDTLKTLRSAVDSLSKEVRDLRETNIGLAKDIGALKERDTHQEREMVRLRRRIHSFGEFLQRLTLRTATGEHVRIEIPEQDDDE